MCDLISKASKTSFLFFFLSGICDTVLDQHSLDQGIQAFRSAAVTWIWVDLVCDSNKQPD